jgi:hypothetical protein
VPLVRWLAIAFKSASTTVHNISFLKFMMHSSYYAETCMFYPYRRADKDFCLYGYSCHSRGASYYRQSVTLFLLTCTSLFWLAVSAAVAGHAVLKVPNAFFQVFGSDPVWLVFMAAIAGVFGVVVSGVAGHAAGIVITVLVDVNYPGRSATTILAGGSGE